MNDLRETIRGKIVSLAKALGNDAGRLRFDEDIPASGLLDSPALMELILWCETQFGIDIDQEQITIDNFGTIDAISRYLESARS